MQRLPGYGAQYFVSPVAYTTRITVTHPAKMGGADSATLSLFSVRERVTAETPEHRLHASLRHLEAIRADAEPVYHIQLPELRVPLHEVSSIEYLDASQIYPRLCARRRSNHILTNKAHRTQHIRQTACPFSMCAD